MLRFRPLQRPVGMALWRPKNFGLLHFPLEGDDFKPIRRSSRGLYNVIGSNSPKRE
jgi:hypothetical protein